MAITTFSQDLSAFFPAGTSLEVRPASNWPAHKRPPEAGTAPLGSATDTAMSSSAGVVAFDGLPDDTEFFVSDAAGTRYVRITTFPERQEVTTDTVSWPLLPGAEVHAEDFGALADGVADDGAAINAAI